MSQSQTTPAGVSAGLEKIILALNTVHRTCANPCEYDHSDYPTRFNVDLTSEMLGSLKPYQRQVRILLQPFVNMLK